RLSQISFLFIKVVDLKKSCRSFTSSGREYRRIAEREAIVVQKISHGLDDGCSHLEYSVLAARAKPQVAMIHQKFRAMLFRSYGIIVCRLHNFCGRYVNLVSARRALVRTNRSPDNQSRLLA